MKSSHLPQEFQQNLWTETNPFENVRNKNFLSSQEIERFHILFAKKFVSDSCSDPECQNCEVI